MTWWQRSIAAGVLAAAAFPPLPTVFAVALIPAFLWLIRIAEESPSGRAAMMRVYPGLLIWNILTTYWLAMATVGGGVAAILANAVVMSIPFGLYRRFRKPHHTLWQNASLFIALYIGFEWIHHQWDLAWPWLTLGNAFSNATALVQWIEVTGVLGLSAWILLIVFAVRQPTMQTIGALSIPVIVSLVMFFMMPYWHVYGKQNLSTETYRTTPEMFANKAQAVVDKYTVRTETDEKVPVVRPPAGGDVYLIARLSGLFALAPYASLLVAVVGTGTALFAATILLTVGINLVVWHYGKLILPIASGLLLIALLYTVNMAWGFFVEARGKRQMTGLFGQ